MKKWIALLLAAALSLTLCACGLDEPENNNQGTNSGGSVEDPTDATEALVLHDNEEGYTFINQNRFRELVEKVELTTENWRDYLGIYSYTEKYTKTDAFGEVVEEGEYTYTYFGPAVERYFYVSEFVIELMDKETQETQIYQMSGRNLPGVTEEFDLDQYECTRIKVTLYFIDLPEEIEAAMTGDVRGFTVRYSDFSYGPPLWCQIDGIDGYRVTGMVDWLLS